MRLGLRMASGIANYSSSFTSFCSFNLRGEALRIQSATKIHKPRNQIIAAKKMASDSTTSTIKIIDSHLHIWASSQQVNIQ